MLHRSKLHVGLPTILSLVALIVLVLAVPTDALAGKCTDFGSDAGKFASVLSKHGAFVAVLVSFGFGVVASLTPCVYPMVPITISIFGATGGGGGGGGGSGSSSDKQPSRLRGAALSGAFVLGIAALFTPMGLISVFTGTLMGSALSSPYVVIALAVLFVALAASMFGAFELALPSSLTNRLSTVGGVGYKGAFVMGLVMGLIAAPCTGPFLTGMLIVIAASKSYVLGAAALFSFALGLGVIFFIAGAFGANLPKGGAWMMGVKWVSGVGLAYMAFAYLRDKFGPVRKLVDHPSYTFGIVAGVLLLIGAGLGVVHVLAERRRSPIARLSKPMKLGSILPAFAGAAMLFTWVNLNHDPVDPNAPSITWLTNEEEAFAKAKAENKPMLIDFGAHWCDGCKELDEHTFTDPKVRAEAQRFVTLHIVLDDADLAEAYTEKYHLIGLPTVIMIDAKGNEVERINKFVPPDQFYAALKCSVPRTNEVVGLND
jgi:thioredoxin:protein disulfide reductase